jgi:FkbM family methyltransferase
MLTSVEWHSFHPRYIQPGAWVLDLGANWGRFSREMLGRFGVTCTAVEPSPEIAAEIMESERLSVVKAAVAAKPGHVSFYVRSAGLCSSTSTKQLGGGDHELKVPAKTLEELIDGRPVGLVKMDIEGSEIEVFDATPDHVLVAIPQMTVEFHDFCGFTPEADVVRVLARLRRLGFYSVRMSGVGHQDTWLINRRMCPISLGELLWIKYVERNVKGARRVLARMFSAGATHPEDLNVPAA